MPIVTPDRRLVLLGAGAALAGCGSTPSPTYDAVVGRGGYETMGEALTAAPGDGRGWRILVKRGRWREKVVVDKPNITLIGEDRAGTVITYDHHAGTPDGSGGTLGTFGSYTILIRSRGFSARNLTFENAFDYDAAARARAAGDAQANAGLQAVAVALGEGADQAWFQDCDITGHQDTLYVNRGRSLFRTCRITGTVDFIFGAGRALFDRCEIVSRARPDAQGRLGWVAAASTLRDQLYGLTFMQCRLTREAGVPDASVGLGRFWRPTTTFEDGRYGNPQAVGSAVFLNCWLDAHIIAEGWDPMGYNARGGTRSELKPEDARPGEYGSTGPGARQRQFQLSAEQAALYAPERVLDGWLPQTR